MASVELVLGCRKGDGEGGRDGGDWIIERQDWAMVAAAM